MIWLKDKTNFYEIKQKKIKLIKYVYVNKPEIKIIIK